MIKGHDFRLKGKEVYTEKSRTREIFIKEGYV
jgi:hypothetical protein